MWGKESECHWVCLQVAFTFISRVDDLCYEGTFGRGERQKKGGLKRKETTCSRGLCATNIKLLSPWVMSILPFCKTHEILTHILFRKKKSFEVTV